MINGLGSVKKRAEAFAAREGQIILVSMSQHKKRLQAQSYMLWKLNLDEVKVTSEVRASSSKADNPRISSIRKLSN